MKLPARQRKPLAGLLIASAAVALAAGLSETSFWRAMELKIYDFNMRAASDPRRADSAIVLIEIDDRAIERMAQNDFGRFPWPRDTYARLLSYLERGRPRAVTFDLLFLEEDRNAEGPARDLEFARASQRLATVVHSIEVNDSYVSRPAETPGARFSLDHSIEQHQSVKLPYPALARASRMLGSTFMLLDADGPLAAAPRGAVCAPGRLVLPVAGRGDSHGGAGAGPGRRAHGRLHARAGLTAAAAD